MRDQFIAFCRERGTDQFDYWDIKACALAQFGRHLNPEAFEVLGGSQEFEFTMNSTWRSRKDWTMVPVLNSDDHIGYCQSFAQIVERLDAR